MPWAYMPPPVIMMSIGRFKGRYGRKGSRGLFAGPGAFYYRLMAWAQDIFLRAERD